MERHLKKPCVPSRASSFGCLQERHSPPCWQRGTMLQDAPGQLASQLVSSAAVQSLSDACCEISLGFQAGSSGKRGTRLPGKSGPQPFCLQPQKQAVGKKFPFQRLRKENQSWQKYLGCCIVYVKCPVLFHLFCELQKCCRTVRGEKKNNSLKPFQVLQWCAVRMPSGLLPDVFSTLGQMDGSSCSLRHWLRIFQRAVTGVFLLFTFFPFSFSKSWLCCFLAPYTFSRSNSQCEKAAALPEMFTHNKEKASQRLGLNTDARCCLSLPDIWPRILTEMHDTTQQQAFNWHPAWPAAFSPILQSQGCSSPCWGALLFSTLQFYPMR